MLERIEGKAFGLWSPCFADELVGCESLEGLEPAAEIVSGDEVGKMLAQLIVTFIVEASDGGILGGAVLDIIGGAGVFEGMGPLAIASLISGTAEPPAPGVVNWILLSVSTVSIL